MAIARQLGLTAHWAPCSPWPRRTRPRIAVEARPSSPNPRSVAAADHFTSPRVTPSPRPPTRAHCPRLQRSPARSPGSPASRPLSCILSGSREPPFTMQANFAANPAGFRPRPVPAAAGSARWPWRALTRPGPPRGAGDRQRRLPEPQPSPTRRTMPPTWPPSSAGSASRWCRHRSLDMAGFAATLRASPGHSTAPTSRCSSMPAAGLQVDGASTPCPSMPGSRRARISTSGGQARQPDRPDGQGAALDHPARCLPQPALARSPAPPPRPGSRRQHRLGSYIAFSTAPGNVAYDGEGTRNSPSPPPCSKNLGRVRMSISA